MNKDKRVIDLLELKYKLTKIRVKKQPTSGGILRIQDIRTEASHNANMPD